MMTNLIFRLFLSASDTFRSFVHSSKNNASSGTQSSSSGSDSASQRKNPSGIAGDRLIETISINRSQSNTGTNNRHHHLPALSSTGIDLSRNRLIDCDVGNDSTCLVRPALPIPSPKVTVQSSSENEEDDDKDEGEQEDEENEPAIEDDLVKDEEQDRSDDLESDHNKLVNAKKAEIVDSFRNPTKRNAHKVIVHRDRSIGLPNRLQRPFDRPSRSSSSSVVAPFALTSPSALSTSRSSPEVPIRCALTTAQSSSVNRRISDCRRLVPTTGAPSRTSRPPLSSADSSSSVGSCSVSPPATDSGGSRQHPHHPWRSPSASPSRLGQAASSAVTTAHRRLVRPRQSSQSNAKSATGHALNGRPPLSPSTTAQPNAASDGHHFQNHPHPHQLTRSRTSSNAVIQAVKPIRLAQSFRVTSDRSHTARGVASAPSTRDHHQAAVRTITGNSIGKMSAIKYGDLMLEPDRKDNDHGKLMPAAHSNNNSGGPAGASTPGSGPAAAASDRNNNRSSGGKASNLIAIANNHSPNAAADAGADVKKSPADNAVRPANAQTNQSSAVQEDLLQPGHVVRGECGTTLGE